MQELFIATRDFLLWLAETSGLTYKEVNVVVWYFFIPFTWAVLLDCIDGKHRWKIASSGLGVVAFAVLYATDSMEWLFDISCQFLLASKVGGNYVNASVVICLFVPLAIYIVLITWATFAVLCRRFSNRQPASPEKQT